MPAEPTNPGSWRANGQAEDLMRKIPLLVATLLFALFSVPPAQATGRILGIFKDGVYTNHEKLFTVQLPFPGGPRARSSASPPGSRSPTCRADRRWADRSTVKTNSCTEIPGALWPS